MHSASLFNVCRITLKPNLLFTSVRKFRTNNCLYLFYEKDPKGGYVDSKKKKLSKIEKIRDGLKQLKGEIELWKEEVKERFETDPLILYRPGETDVVWKFGTPKTLNNWIATSDRDHNEGYSTCSLTLSPQGHAVFSGDLDTRIPKDGKIKKSGYCNIKTARARKSFKRDSYLDWTPYNMLVMRVRGDGRSYLLNLHTTGYFDVMWFDIYHYILFTRGGPYWQTARIPFSKFFLSSKGRVQDRQYQIPLDRIANFGITAGDKINGPFNLEIDYIGLEFDPLHEEEFAYEMYKLPKYMVAT